MSVSSPLQKDITRTVRAFRRRVGRNVHALRCARGMRLEKLARLSGVGVGRLDLLELGKGELGLELIVRVAGALGVTPEGLLASGDTITIVSPSCLSPSCSSCLHGEILIPDPRLSGDDNGEGAG